MTNGGEWERMMRGTGVKRNPAGVVTQNRNWSLADEV